MSAAMAASYVINIMAERARFELTSPVRSLRFSSSAIQHVSATVILHMYAYRPVIPAPGERVAEADFQSL